MRVEKYDACEFLKGDETNTLLNSPLKKPPGEAPGLQCMPIFEENDPCCRPGPLTGRCLHGRLTGTMPPGSARLLRTESSAP